MMIFPITQFCPPYTVFYLIPRRFSSTKGPTNQTRVRHLDYTAAHLLTDKPVWWAWTLPRIVQCWATSAYLISTIFWIFRKFRFRFEPNFVQLDFRVENFIEIGQNWNFVIFLNIFLNPRISAHVTWLKYTFWVNFDRTSNNFYV